MEEKYYEQIIREGKSTVVRPGNTSSSILISEAAEVLRLELARQLWSIVMDSHRLENQNISSFRESLKNKLIALVNLNQQ